MVCSLSLLMVIFYTQIRFRIKFEKVLIVRNVCSRKKKKKKNIRAHRNLQISTNRVVQFSEFFALKDKYFVFQDLFCRFRLDGMTSRWCYASAKPTDVMYVDKTAWYLCLLELLPLLCRHWSLNEIATLLGGEGWRQNIKFISIKSSMNLLLNPEVYRQ